MTAATAILGINAAHDASACLLLDGRLVVAIPEERLSRVKHHEGFPQLAVDYCLRAGDLHSLHEIDCLVINEYTHTDFTLQLRNEGLAGRIITNPSHHLLHAYYAWCGSGFTDTAIMILDGSGYSYGEYVRRKSPLLGPAPAFSEMEEAESLYQVRGGEIDVVSKRWALWEAMEPYYRFPSLGHMFSMASQYIFGHFQHAGKTMGLAPYGDPDMFPEPFVDIRDDGMEVATEWVTRLPPRSDKPAHVDEVCCNLAAKVQAELERAVLHLCGQLYQLTGQTRLCISGGVGLNSVTNGRVLRESPFTELFVTPAAGDAGISIGAAVYGHHQLTGRIPEWDYRDDYHGRSYDESEVQQALAQRSALVHAERLSDIPARAARDIADGKVIGWYDGGAEFGPRALGHRSILCDPRRADIPDLLNARVKFREPFRPYAASVLGEHAHEYFDLDVDDPFMLVVAPIHEQRRDLIPAVRHVDNTCRIQSVRPRHGKFRQVIKSFYALSGIPMVLNTSFNIRGEPIAETPAEALDCFLGCNMDVLYLQGYRITKELVGDVERPGALVPRLSPGLRLGIVVDIETGAAGDARYHAQTRTGYRMPISAEEFELMRLVDANSTIDAIAAQLGRDVTDIVHGLQEKGLACVELANAAGAGGPIGD